MDEQPQIEEHRDEEPARVMNVTKLTDLSEGIYWTLNEEATEVVVYDAITSRQLTNVVRARTDYHDHPEFGNIMSVVLDFVNPDDPDQKPFSFAGDILHLEHVETEEEESQCGGGGGSGNEQGGNEGEEQEDESGDASSGEDEEGGESGEGEGQEGEGQGEGQEGEGQGKGETEGGSGGKPEDVTEEYQPGGVDAHEGGGDVAHETEGEIKVGRRTLGWQSKRATS